MVPIVVYFDFEKNIEIVSIQTQLKDNVANKIIVALMRVKTTAIL